MSAEADDEAREVLVSSLAVGATIAAAARASRYSYRQAHRLAHDPKIQNLVAMRQARLHAAVAPPAPGSAPDPHLELRQLSLGALRRVLEGEATEPRDLLAACKIVLSMPRPGAAPVAESPPAPIEAPVASPLTAEQATARFRVVQ